MKKIYQKICLPVLVLLIISACKKDLTEKPYSDLSAETYNYTDAYKAMGISYANMRALFSHTSYYMLQETSSDEIVMPANGSGWDDGGIYKRIHLHTWNSENPQMNEMWRALYSGVTNSNRVIEQLETGKIPPPSGVTKEALVSEMKVVRAFFYWLICDNFGNAPLVTTTSPDLPETAARKDIYDFIVKEITDALPNLSVDNNVLMYGRFNRWGAKALLANIYLNAQVYTGTAKYQDCLTQCNDIIASGKYSLDAVYKNIFKTDNSGSPEIVFSIPFDETVGNGFFTEMYSWHGALKAKVNMQATPWGSGSAMGVGQFIDTYDAADKRLSDTWLSGPQFAADGTTPLLGSYDQAGKPLNFTKDLPDGLFTGESEGFRMNKFEVKTGAKSNLSNDFPFFRYAEVLMMKAECLVRAGNSAEAAQIVSQVRTRDFTDASKAIVTGAQLDQNSRYKYGYVEKYKVVDAGNTAAVQYGGMLDELGFEFPWEGHRRRDNIRFGTFTTKSWLSHKPTGAFRILFPIPQQALNSNPKLKQNDGY